MYSSSVLPCPESLEQMLPFLGPVSFSVVTEHYSEELAQGKSKRRHFPVPTMACPLLQNIPLHAVKVYTVIGLIKRRMANS